MTDTRYNEIFCEGSPLSEEETAQGWHHCGHWDGLLVGPGMGEFDFCVADGGCDGTEPRSKYIGLRFFCPCKYCGRKECECCDADVSADMGAKG